MSRPTKFTPQEGRTSEDFLLGRAVREARKRKGLTLQALADQIDISIGLLSQIERGQSSPSVRVLRAICSNLDLDGAVFFHFGESPAHDSQASIIVREAARRRLEFVDQKVTKYKISPNEPGSLEAYLIELDPGGKSGDQSYSHPGHEFGFVLEGHLEIFLEDDLLCLSAGDTFRFESTRHHRWRNGWGGRTRVIWVLSAPFYV